MLHLFAWTWEWDESSYLYLVKNNHLSLQDCRSASLLMRRVSLHLSLRFLYLPTYYPTRLTYSLSYFLSSTNTLQTCRSMSCCLRRDLRQPGQRLVNLLAKRQL